MKATASGMTEAMIAAAEASTYCIAIQFRPRYSAFWHRPKTMTVRHSARLRCQLWPMARASATATTADSAKRMTSAVSGGAASTIMRVVVNAEAHMRAKPSPIRMALKSMRGPLLAPKG